MIDAAPSDLAALEEAMTDTTNLDAVMVEVEAPHSVAASNETCGFDRRIRKGNG